jgi:hypothetical protein
VKRSFSLDDVGRIKKDAAGPVGVGGLPRKNRAM